MIYYKTEEEIELVRKSSLLVAKTHAEIAGLIKPGITTLALDKLLKNLSGIMEEFQPLKVMQVFLILYVCHQMIK